MKRGLSGLKRRGRQLGGDRSRCVYVELRICSDGDLVGEG
jgi:hypothetical protein